MSSDLQPPEADRPIPLGGEDADVLLAHIRRDSRRCRLAGLAVGAVILLLVAAATCTAPGVFFGADSGPRVEAYLAFAGLVGVVGAGLLAVMGRSIGRLTRGVASLDDARAVGPLAEHVIGAGSWPHASIRDALLRLVPRMRAEDLEALTPNERHCLAALLTSDELLHSGLLHGPDLKLAILGVLEQFGDRRETGAVRYLCYRAHDPDVREAARRCLERLEVRVMEQEPTAPLLRPVEAPSEAALLRPATAASEADSSALLRPTGTDE